MLRPDRAPGEPFLIFDTEREYRDHLGEAVGKRIGREQQKLTHAEDEIVDLRERVHALESSLAEYRRGDVGAGTPLHPG
jgi:hypothetical protein